MSTRQSGHTVFMTERYPANNSDVIIMIKFYRDDSLISKGAPTQIDQLLILEMRPKGECSSAHKTRLRPYNSSFSYCP